MGQDEHDEFADLSEEYRALAQRIKEGALDFAPTPGATYERAYVRPNSSTGAVELEPGDFERLFVVRELAPDEIRRARKKILLHHYLESAKTEATAKIEKAFGLFPSDQNTHFPHKRLLGICTFNSTVPSVHRCCGQDSAKRVWVCGRLYVYRGNYDGSTGGLLRRALELQPRDIVVSYADTSQGHTGAVYKNNGFTYRDSGSLTTEHWDWYDKRTPRLDGQTVKNQMGRERAAGTFDTGNYGKRPRTIKHCWVWFRNPGDEALCRWPVGQPPQRLDRGYVRHPNDDEDEAPIPSPQVPATIQARYTLIAEVCDEANGGTADEETMRDRYDLAEAIMRTVSTWKALKHAGRAQPCVVSEIRTSWYTANRTRWTGAQVRNMAEHLCGHAYLDRLLLGVTEFTVTVGARPFPYRGVKHVLDQNATLTTVRRLINEGFANETTAAKLAEKIMAIQKALDRAHDDNDVIGIERLNQELLGYQDTLRIFTQQAWPEGVPTSLHRVRAALMMRCQL